jgi:hypothetical protein
MYQILNKNAVLVTCAANLMEKRIYIPKDSSNNIPKSILIQGNGICRIQICQSFGSLSILQPFQSFYYIGYGFPIEIFISSKYYDVIEIDNLTDNEIKLSITPLD